MEIINKNIENPAYSIDQFSEEIGMSRVQVYRKIKAVTGMSPSKLILDIRLKNFTRYASKHRIYSDRSFLSMRF